MSSLDLAIGQTIGDYEVLAVLGAGGMGKVYKVRSTISQRVEAMKILLPDLNAAPELAERFLREIQIAASLDHPNIGALRAAQRVDNQLLMVMEFVDGSTLSALMLKSRVPLERCLQIISQALAALEYAHSRNVIHRDIKPENIMITSTGEVKLMDFGIAKLSTNSSLTRTGMMLGSVPYMSPEHIEGRDIDGRSDIYSIGVTLYELVTGKRPFSGKSDFEVMTAHLTTSPQSPREIDPTVPGPVNEIILTAMAKNPSERFATAKAMRNAVNSISSAAQIPISATRQAASLNTTVAMSHPAGESQGPVIVPVGGQTAKPAAGSHRTAYMLVGSLATVVVLIAGALELPRLFQTKANDKVVVGQPVAPAVTTPTPTASPAEARHNPSQVETAPSPQANSPQATQAAPAVNHPSSDAKPASTGKSQAPRLQTKTRESTPMAAPASNNDAPAASAAKSSTNENAPAVQAPPSAPAAAPSNSQLSELRDRMMLMNVRVSGVRASLGNLKSAQGQSGLGLRRDMVDAEERLVYQMNEAANGINANDAAGALKRLDAAEKDLDKLESFLGK